MKTNKEKNDFTSAERTAVYMRIVEYTHSLRTKEGKEQYEKLLRDLNTFDYNEYIEAYSKVMLQIMEDLKEKGIQNVTKDIADVLNRLYGKEDLNNICALIDGYNKGCLMLLLSQLDTRLVNEYTVKMNKLGSL